VTLYGIDVASYQAGLNLDEVKAESFDFIIAKATQGSGYVDPSWASFRDGADANDLILVAYHYVTLDAAAAQAENLVSALGDTGIPVMLDFEAGSGDLANFWAVTDAITAAAHTSHCPTFPAGTGSRSAYPT
jgi:GH25 family lysozyme M1 (1,4-beta-N-acetylmuramidase)